MAIALDGTGATPLAVRKALGLPTLFPSGGDDTAALTAAVTAAGVNGTIRLGVGTFTIDTDAVALLNGQRLIGYGPFFTRIETTDLTGVLIDITSVGDVQMVDLGIYLEGVTSAVVGIDLDGAFRCMFERVSVGGDHTASTPQVNTIGTRFVNNAGDNSFVDCDWRNLGVGIQTESIMNYVTGSRFGTCWYGIRGGDAAGSAIGAGISVQTSSFTSSHTAQHTTSWVKIDGTSNLWWFDGCWFEGAITTIDVGSASYGPYGFSMVNCKVSAETTCINLATSRQTHLANVTFNGDNSGVDTPAELVIDASGCPDGTAINLVSLQSTHVDATFPAGWSVLGRGQATIPDTRTIRLPLYSFLGVSGVTYAQINTRAPGWQFDAAADEIISGVFEVPASWTTWHLDIICLNMTTDTGVVTWRCDLREFNPEGGTLNAAPSTGSEIDWTAGSQYVTDRVRVKTGASATDGYLQQIRLLRVGTSVDDTKAGDAAIIALELVRAS